MNDMSLEKVGGNAVNPLDDGSVLPAPALMSAETRAEIDTQITTAKAYPRSIHSFKDQALGMATLDVETAQGCMYAVPRQGKTIQGPSVRLAEIIASAWGNIRTEAMIVGEDAFNITAEATTWDLEKNLSMRIQVKRRIVDRNGRKFSPDMVTVTGNAAVSIALRNSIFRVIPRAFTDAVYRAARQVAIGEASTLANRRAAAFEKFGLMGATEEQVLRKLGRASQDDVTLDDLASLIGLYNAIKDGEFTVDECFAVNTESTATANADKPKGVEAVKAKLVKDTAPIEPETEASKADVQSAGTDDVTPEPSVDADPEPENANDDGLDSQTENLRTSVQERLASLGSSIRKDLIAGKPVPAKMTLDELQDLDRAIAEHEK